MKTKHLTILSIALIVSAIFAGKIFAQEISGQAENITYPVKELDNCKDKADCRAYCDLPQNIEACVDFGEKNNLMSKEEAQTAKKFIAAGANGPGNCKNKEACEEYCDDIANIDECVAFAEKSDLLPPKELEEAKKVQAAVKRGVKLPNCSNKKTCDVYCEEPDHMEECIAFGAEAGFIQGKELEEAQKMVAAVKRGVRPPPCRGKEACDAYCSAPDNMEMCMNFALEAGFMSEQEAADSQKMLAAIKKGVKPPKCTGKEACDAYCSSEENFEECASFAEAAGFMSPEEAVMARKTKGKGPGDCKGKEACEAFCNNPDNQETCFNFAKENGLISEEELKNIEEGKQKSQESFNQMPPEVLECVNSLLGADVVEKIKSGEMMPSRDIGDKMSECFKNMGPPQGEQGQGPGSPFGGPEGSNVPPPNGQYQTGPGGCTNPEECRAYCQSNPQECQNFQPPSQPQTGTAPFQPPSQEEPVPAPAPNDNQNLLNGLQPPPNGQYQTGPSGCTNPEECQQIIQQQMMNQIPQIPQEYPIEQLGIQPPPEGQSQYPNQPIEQAPPVEQQSQYPNQPIEQAPPVEQQSQYPTPPPPTQ